MINGVFTLEGYVPEIHATGLCTLQCVEASDPTGRQDPIGMSK